MKEQRRTPTRTNNFKPKANKSYNCKKGCMNPFFFIWDTIWKMIDDRAVDIERMRESLVTDDFFFRFVYENQWKKSPACVRKSPQMKCKKPKKTLKYSKIAFWKGVVKIEWLLGLLLEEMSLWYTSKPGDIFVVAYQHHSLIHRLAIH